MSDKIQEALLTVENLFIEQDKAHHTEIASLKEDISGMQLVIQTFQRLTSSESFGRIKAAAHAEGLPVEAWMIEKLLEATMQHPDIRVGTDLYMQLQSLAQMRNIPLDTLTNGKLFTQAVQQALDNRHL